jgi:nucleotide-binding universal stress UspA family protein
MTVSYRKVLFATDLTARSRHAFPHAADIAARHGAGMVFVHVLEGLTDRFQKRIESYLGADALEQIRSGQEEDVRRILIGKKSERKVLAETLSLFVGKMREEAAFKAFQEDRIVVRTGANVAEEILKTARDTGCDLMVLAGSGAGGPSGTLNSVLAASGVPVLVVGSRNTS